MEPPDILGLTPSEVAAVYERLRSVHQGVCTPKHLHNLLQDFVGQAVALEELALVRAGASPPASLLDVGSGFGAFVLAARAQGFQAIGVEIDAEDVGTARRRLERIDSTASPADVFREGDAHALPFGTGTFDVVTTWNVLEHTRDPRQVLTECWRVLRPGGTLFVMAPNYSGLFVEPHYHVAWLPRLPRRLASRYLRARGRDPSFFEREITYVGRRDVVEFFQQEGIRPRDLRSIKIEHPEAIHAGWLRALVKGLGRARLSWTLRALAALHFHNPFNGTVAVYARKPAVPVGPEPASLPR